MASVLEFVEYRPKNEQVQTITDPLTKIRIKAGNVATGSGLAIANLFKAALEKHGIVVDHNNYSTEGLSVKNIIDKNSYFSKTGFADDENLVADILVIGTVARYEERIGSKIAVDRPASVGFSIAVVDVKTRIVIWAGKYEKKQIALFDNLLDYSTFLKGGMVWTTANELSAIGVEKAISEMGFESLARN
tara:strand:+ start:157595 stop:158164 length:570 start_codon:yes stop_codon:yes gene_type:complete